mgnify:CR=1 FL=1
MEMGSELSKTVATFIVQKILLDSVGLAYICATAERFFAVSAVLASVVAALPDAPSARLLKHVTRCYLRLSDNARAREALRQCLPPLLTDPGLTACLGGRRADPGLARPTACQRGAGRGRPGVCGERDGADAAAGVREGGSWAGLIWGGRMGVAHCKRVLGALRHGRGRRVWPRF